jgi:hypothetical protein
MVSEVEPPCIPILSRPPFLGAAALALDPKIAGDIAVAIPNADVLARNSRRVILPFLNMLSSFSKVFMIFLLSPAKQPCSLFGVVAAF